VTASREMSTLLQASGLADAGTPADRAAIKLAQKLALRGVQRVGGWYHASWDPYCDDPPTVVYQVNSRSQVRMPVGTSFKVPCRKCDKCRLFRRMRWRHRIINEIVKTDDLRGRSWFITLTFSPVHLAGVRSEAARRERRGTDAAKALDMAAYAHVSGYLKRLRAVSKAKFRFVAVPEFGERFGRLHYHLIVHEIRGVVTSRMIETRWRSHVHARLVRADGERGIVGAASYLSKYVAKDFGRVRASTAYGAAPGKTLRQWSGSLF